MMDKYFQAKFKTFEQSVEDSKSFTQCGICRRYMKIILRNCKLICKHCDKTYALPKVPPDLSPSRAANTKWATSVPRSAVTTASNS
jgi:hypothetical protein